MIAEGRWIVGGNEFPAPVRLSFDRCIKRVMLVNMLIETPTLVVSSTNNSAREGTYLIQLMVDVLNRNNGSPLLEFSSKRFYYTLLL